MSFEMFDTPTIYKLTPTIKDTSTNRACFLSVTGWLQKHNNKIHFVFKNTSPVPGETISWGDLLDCYSMNHLHTKHVDIGFKTLEYPFNVFIPLMLN